MKISCVFRSAAFLIPYSWKMENPVIPICKNCQHIRYNYWNETVCSLYGKINVIDGWIHYEHCSIVRNTDEKCGIDGKYYIRTIPFSSLKD